MEEQNKLAGLVDNLLEKIRAKLVDPITIAEKYFRDVSNYPWNECDRDKKVGWRRGEATNLFWYAQNGFPGLREKLLDRWEIQRYAKNDRNPDEVRVGFKTDYITIELDGESKSFSVPSFADRGRTQAEIDRYKEICQPILDWWQNALAPLAEAWGKEESAVAAERAAERAAGEAKEAYEKSLGDKIRTALTAWAAGMAAKQTKWEDYLRFHAAGGSAVDCRDSTSFWQNRGVEVAELDVRVSNDDGTYLRVETSYPLTGADTTEYLRRRNPEALSAQEAKEVLKQWETEQIPMIGVLEAAKAAEAEAAEAERLSAVKAEIAHCVGVIDAYLTNFNLIADAVGRNAAPSLAVVEEDEDEAPDQHLKVLTAWLKLAEVRWKYIQRAAEEAASLLIKTIEVVEVEDEDDAPHQNPVTVVGNTMYTVTVPAESVWSCSVDDTEDFDEDIYKKAGEVADQYGDMHIVFYRPRKTDRRGGRNGRR